MLLLDKNKKSKKSKENMTPLIQPASNSTHSKSQRLLICLQRTNFSGPTKLAEKTQKLNQINPSMAATSLLPKSLSPFLKNPHSPFPSTHLTKLAFLNSQDHPHNSKTRPNNLHTTNAKKKNPWLDPFDDGEDPDMEYGSLFADGKQEEDPRPADNPGNPYGFLKFPKGFNVEIAPLALKVRGDVRRCCCIISGGVYENLLFFPVIQLIKDRYPGVQIDVIAADRGKQTYELNKNVRWANVYDPDDYFPEPAEYTDMLGVLKVSDIYIYIFNT